MTDPITAVARALLGPATGAVKRRAFRSPEVVRLLSRFGLAGEAPPADFRSVYARALAEYCDGTPAAVVELLADEWVRSAFEKCFASGDWGQVRTELRNAIERNRETREFGQLHDLDIGHIDGFITVFERLVAATRDPAHVASDRTLDRIAADMAEVRAGLGLIEQVRQSEEEYRQAREPARREATSLERLESDVSEWLTAMNYVAIEQLEQTEREFGWVVKAPVTPGRYARVVLIGVDGELLAGQVARALEEKERQGAQGVWLVARLRLSSGAQEVARRDGSVLCLTFDDLVDMAVDFEPYVDWLDGEVKRVALDARYVQLSCRRDEPDGASSEYPWQDGGLDEYAYRWLADPARDHLSVLGEFGSGKSWFSLHMAWQLSKLWRAARERGLPRPRLPLLIPLRDYAKAADVAAVVSKFLFERNIALNERIFDYLNRTGRLLLIFDGFDEMAARVDRQTMVANFWELAKVAHEGTKVLLSSRTEHFPDAQQTRRLLSGEVHAAVNPPEGEKPRFDVVEISPLDDEQINRMIRARTTDEEISAFVTGEPGLRDLLRRPVMSDLILTALPEIRAGEPVDLSHVYLYAIRHKLDEDIKAERTFTSRADKLYFLCELAWEMESTSTLSMHYRLFPERLRAYFGAAVAAERDLDHWEHDMRAQTLLNRDASGQYTPAHRSLLEWFVAYKFAAELGLLSGAFLDLLGTASPDGAPALWSEYFADRRPNGTLPPLSSFTAEPISRLALTFGQAPVDGAVAGFLQSMVAAHTNGAERLLAIARATGDAGAEAGVVGANCVMVARLQGRQLQLAGARLAGLAPQGTVSLAGADLRDTDLTDADLGAVDLQGANLIGARLNGPEILRSGISVDGVIVTADGTIVADTNQALYAWDDGDLGSPPRQLATPGDIPIFKKSRSILALTGDQFYGGPRYLAIVSADTGQMTPVRPMESGWAVRWQGAPALLRHDPQGWFTVHNPFDLTTEAHIPFPTTAPEKKQFGHIVYSDKHGLCNAARVGERLIVERYDDSADEWATLAHWQWSDGRRVAFVRDAVWFRSDKNAAMLMYDLAGRLIWKAEGLGAEYGRPELLSESSGVVIVLRSEQIEGWPLAGGTSRWRVALPLKAYGLTLHPDGESFLYATAGGELARRRIDTGELLSQAVLSTRLRGATFSRTCGLDDSTMAALETAGANLV